MPGRTSNTTIAACACPVRPVWYPLMVMDWVEGATLLQYVRTRCLAGKASSMAKAARHWAALVQELAKARIVHGDLEPANVLVTRTGKLKLVDYDTMCVPALAGLPSLEVGIEPYRHPRRISRHAAVARTGQLRRAGDLHRVAGVGRGSPFVDQTYRALRPRHVAFPRRRLPRSGRFVTLPRPEEFARSRSGEKLFPSLNFTKKV